MSAHIYRIAFGAALGTGVYWYASNTSDENKWMVSIVKSQNRRFLVYVLFLDDNFFTLFCSKKMFISFVNVSGTMWIRTYNFL